MSERKFPKEVQLKGNELGWLIKLAETGHDMTEGTYKNPKLEEMLRMLMLKFHHHNFYHGPSNRAWVIIDADELKKELIEQLTNGWSTRERKHEWKSFLEEEIKLHYPLLYSILTRKSKPVKCKCGGTFVPPSDLGLDGDGYLVCDNEDRGDGEPCEEWIPE